MSIDFKDISVVIQGPVQAYQGRSQEPGITHKCIASIRTHLPGATIILSTWEGQDCHGLNPDILLLNKDPGATIVSYNAKGEPGKLNFNRQIVSSAEGLKQVTTPYAVKIRSDNFLTSNDFVAAQQAFPARNDASKLFTQKVVTNTSYFRRYADGQKIVMLPSDFFHFGLTEDLLKIWDIPLFPDREFDPTKAGSPQYRGAPKVGPHAEQIYCNAWLRKLDSTVPYLQHRHQNSPELLAYWERFIASNLVVLEPEQIGLGLIQRFIPKSKRPNEICHQDWLLLYKQYCDPSIAISKFDIFKTIGWKRMCKLPFSYIKHQLTQIKK
ncbi:WavE lipopolysaccharide synthesis family protein [Shewanella schlegeliana]|uniref:WavE lipopolysaccharide synthesis family protein n=2 Tax=Shewanella schlegeliana TaxID=190308 RepID=A0ABS1T3I6_9GAMM|nr:WavE lipopolysaccharide synthesis family protein [Shewanella schlegeliana]MBL4915264.1 WavE lipopolysaccharide synthesis family protein [Shewanella schlegeliana]MCL1111225.1 WavE lipopolysaccharide synthesis family protein [Shewanella schlegeliana]